MLSEEICEFLLNLNLCGICVSRYVNKHNFDLTPKTTTETDEVKRSKPNICIVCLGIFQGIDSDFQQIINNSSLHTYECSKLYSSISIPISLLIRELSVWIALLEKFPGKISDSVPPNISIKDAFKSIFNKKLCEATNRTLDFNQNGVLVNLFYEYELDKNEIQPLLAVKPFSLNAKCDNRKNRKNVNTMTRNFFEKHYYPKNLNLEDYKTQIAVPSEITVSTPTKLVRYFISGPTIFVAGRYRKLSRDLSQTPWILNGKRMKEDSIQEIISREICLYFGINDKEESEKIIFMASGREDIDVRCLGKGRPFVLQISDARKSTLPQHIAADMELRVEHTKQVSVQHLQLVCRDELVNIKTGEEEKQKFYRALCVLKTSVTAENIKNLNIPNGFLVHQKTPLRVLHRRPLLTRPRQIFSVKAYAYKEHRRVIVLDIVTQAGAYIKELIHGEFGRTSPCISSLLGQDIDIIALDVNAIKLDWPADIHNGIQ